MMKFHQGDVVWVSLDPIKGHEQGAFRPVLVISAIPLPGGLSTVLPITTKEKSYPLEVPLDTRTKTQGMIMCHQIRTLDLERRDARLIEQVPEDILNLCVEYVSRMIGYVA